MADNVTMNPGSGGAVAAADDIGSVYYQRVKLTLGADGVNDGDVSSTNPIPVRQTTNSSNVVTSTSTLASGATYTSSTFDVTQVGGYVTHFIYSDKEGTHYYDESHDGSTWYTVDQDDIEAGDIFSETHCCTARYHRTRFTNTSASAQTTFICQTVPRFTGEKAYQEIEAVERSAHSTTNLAAGATWTSKVFNTNDGVGWSFFIYSDQNGTYTIEESNDQVTWYQTDSGTSTGGTPFGETQVAKADHFRFKWTNNGGVSTTAVDLYVRQLSMFTGIPESININENNNFVQQGADTPWDFQGTLTNNSGAASTAVNIGVLAGISSASRSSNTEGYQTLLSQFLNGCLRVQEDGTGTYGTPSQVATSGTSAQLIAANTSRKGLVVHNDSSAICYMKFGTTASSTSYTYALQPGAMFEMAHPLYTGRVDVILATGSGNAMVTEIS